MAACCKDCKFPLPLPGMGRNAKGEEVHVSLCRRFPPQIAVNGASTFPVVADTEWCGEFQLLTRRPLPNGRKKGAK